jgi:hypothetical protein
MAQKPSTFVPAVFDSFVDAIGNTPVILLKGASERTGCKYVRTLGNVAPTLLFVVVAAPPSILIPSLLACFLLLLAT